MELRSEDIILKKSAPLYSNIAHMAGCKGRLSTYLDMYPVPRISWEFEVLGRKSSSSRLLTQLSLTQPNAKANPIQGYNFEIPEPVVASWSQDFDGSRIVLRGYAAEVNSGRIDSTAQYFQFYLPNTKFQEVNLTGQQLIAIKREEGKNRKFIGSGSAGRSIESTLDTTWAIRLEITQQALDWMESKQHSVGTFITSTGSLFPITSTSQKKRSLKPSLTLKEALARLGNLSLLLSYANGGYIGPLFIQGFRNKPKVPKLIASGARSFMTTPIEQLGISWITIDSDLTSYLQCLQSLNRMTSQLSWESTLPLILSWYFQVTSLPKAWPIVANGVGAALERLSYVILVLDETNTTMRQKVELLFDIARQNQARIAWQIGQRYGNNLSVTGKRLQLLLERIGITKGRGYIDVDDVMNFLAVRNEATHPKPSGIEDTKKQQLMRQAIQWVDEVLLWRLGYKGKYLDRSQDWRASREPRYDLSLREISW